MVVGRIRRTIDDFELPATRKLAGGIGAALIATLTILSFGFDDPIQVGIAAIMGFIAADEAAVVLTILAGVLAGIFSFTKRESSEAASVGIAVGTGLFVGATTGAVDVLVMFSDFIAMVGGELVAGSMAVFAGITGAIGAVWARARGMTSRGTAAATGTAAVGGATATAGGAAVFGTVAAFLTSIPGAIVAWLVAVGATQSPLLLVLGGGTFVYIFSGFLSDKGAIGDGASTIIRVAVVALVAYLVVVEVGPGIRSTVFGTFFIFGVPRGDND